MKKAKQSYQSFTIFLFGFVFLFIGINPVFSQDDDVTECPYFTIFGPDTTGLNFSLVSTDIDATISGVIANVVIEQTYINSGDSIVDATYVFPMSTNAAVYGMKMIVNDKVIEAVIKRKDEAQTIFDTANEAGHTASLLELQRPNVFQMSLANIIPGDSLKVQMVYTELLVPEKGTYQFVFPNIVGPRFTTDGESWVTQSIVDSLAVSETALNINLKINAGMAVSADCKSHNVAFNYLNNTTECSLSTNPGDDFIVDYTLNRDQIETGLLLYEGEEENFFLSIIQPAKPEIDFTSPSREYIFIMDVSGSMNGEPIDVSKTLIENLLTDLNEEDKFNIIFFAGGSDVLAPSSLPVTQANINMAINHIDNISAGGSTQLLPAMNVALGMQGTEGYSRTFVILTDGYVTVEKEAFELIRENLNEANFFSFGIGSSVNRYIIEGIAYVGEGASFIATDDFDAYDVADTFKEYIERPALTNIEVAFDGIAVYDVEPLTIPDVFAERPIIVYGKYHKPANGSITLSGDYAEGNISNSFAFEDYATDTEENIALKYLWARKRIKLMSDYGIASNENDTLSIEEEITLLGLKYSLVTEFTSFVAVDSSSVTSTSGNGNNNDENGDIVEVDEVDISSQQEKSIITLLGTITLAGDPLRLRLEDLDTQKEEDLFLQITDINGHILNRHQLSNTDWANVISLDLGHLPKGIYFVTLISKSEIFDTEQFIVH